jgi:hypothetical protein
MMTRHSVPITANYFMTLAFLEEQRPKLCYILGSDPVRQVFGVFDKRSSNLCPNLHEFIPGDTRRCGVEKISLQAPGRGNAPPEFSPNWYFRQAWLS